MQVPLDGTSITDCDTLLNENSLDSNQVSMAVQVSIIRLASYVLLIQKVCYTLILL